MKQKYKTKYDNDIIFILILTLDYLVENKYNTSEIYHLAKHLQEDTETTLKLLRLEGMVARLSSEIEYEIDRVKQMRSELKEVQSKLDDVLSKL